MDSGGVTAEQPGEKWELEEEAEPETLNCRKKKIYFIFN